MGDHLFIPEREPGSVSVCAGWGAGVEDRKKGSEYQIWTVKGLAQRL